MVLVGILKIILIKFNGDIMFYMVSNLVVKRECLEYKLKIWGRKKLENIYWV